MRRRRQHLNTTEAAEPHANYLYTCRSQSHKALMDSLNLGKSRPWESETTLERKLSSGTTNAEDKNFSSYPETYITVFPARYQYNKSIINVGINTSVTRSD